MRKHKHSIIAFLLLATVIGLQLISHGTTQVAYADCQTPVNNSVSQNCIVVNYIKPGINFLSAGVGVIITIMIVVGAIQFITSGGNPQGVADARKKIFNALLAFLTFIFIYSFLNFVIPGGVIPI